MIVMSARGIVTPISQCKQNEGKKARPTDPTEPSELVRGIGAL